MQDEFFKQSTIITFKQEVKMLPTQELKAIRSRLNYYLMVHPGRYRLNVDGVILEIKDLDQIIEQEEKSRLYKH